MADYDDFSNYYDKVMWKPTELAVWIKYLAKEYNPKAKSVLELACGTANLLDLLKDDFKVTGLDISEGMLHRAKEKLPDVDFIKGDMTDFCLESKFDMIACIFDSINHVKGLENWSKVFRHSSDHLNNNGLFIFDYNTQYRLENLSKTEGHTDKFEDKELEMKVRKNKDAYTFYTKITRNGETLMEDQINEYTYSNDEVVKEASKYFKTVDCYAEDMKSLPQQDARRIYLVCRK